MDVGTRKYRAFVSSAQHLSFTQAAQELGCTQSAVSRMVATLEADWGLVLFERHGSKLALTSDGKALLPSAYKFCEALKDLDLHAHSLKGLESGTLDLAAPSSIIALRLAGPLGNFIADHPGIQVRIVECTYAEAVRLMEEGKVDVAFSTERSQLPALSAELFERDELVVVSPHVYFHKADKLPISALIDAPFVADTETAPLLQEELQHPSVRCETSNIMSILAMVEAGIGVSLLPSLALSRDSIRVDVHHLKNPTWRNIYLMRRMSDLSPATSAFLSYLDPEQNKVGAKSA